MYSFQPKNLTEISHKITKMLAQSRDCPAQALDLWLFNPIDHVILRIKATFRTEAITKALLVSSTPEPFTVHADILSVWVSKQFGTVSCVGTHIGGPIHCMLGVI